MTLPKAALLCALVLSPCARAIDDTVTIVDGISTNIGAYVTSGTNNLLIITNGGIASITSFASQSTARSNIVIVTGSGSVLSNSGSTAFASSGGSSNALLFLNGGRTRGTLNAGGTNNLIIYDNTAVTNGFTFAGRSNYLSASNSIIQSGAIQFTLSLSEHHIVNSQWSDSDTSFGSARSNRFSFLQGSRRFGGNFEFGSSGNILEFSGSNTLWVTTNYAIIDNSDSGKVGNTVTISDSARADLRQVTLGGSTHFNQFIASGIGTLVTASNAFELAFSTGNSNSVTFADGAQLISGSSIVSGSIGNFFTVKAARWNNVGALQFTGGTNTIQALNGAAIVTGTFSASGKSNLLSLDPTSTFAVVSNFSAAQNLTISGGGQIQSSNLILSGGASHRLELSAGTRWNVATNITFNTTSNTFIISSGAILQAPRLEMGVYAASTESASNNLFRITDPFTTVTIPTVVATSRWQRISIENAAIFKSQSFTSLRGSATVDVTGTNSTWINSGEIVSASFATNDAFHISAGRATNSNATIGQIFSNTFPAPTTPFRTFALLSLDSGAQWTTTNQLHLGYNANSNSITIAAGSKLSASNLFIGQYEFPNAIPNGKVGSENSLRIDGTNSQLNLTGDLFLGYGSSSNRLTITTGAVVIARAFYAGMIPPNPRSPDPGFVNLQSNVVEIVGLNAGFRLSSSFAAGGANHLVLSNFATVTAAGVVTLSDKTFIRADSALFAGALVQALGTTYLQENSLVSGGEIRFGHPFSATKSTVTGPRAALLADTVHIMKTDPQVPGPNALTSFELLDRASLTSRVFTIGLASSNFPPKVLIDGGSLGATEILDLDQGSLSLNHGSIHAAKLRVRDNNSSINAAGPLTIATDPLAAADGEIHIDTSAELRGTNQFAAITLGANSEIHLFTKATTVPILTATGPATLGGRLTIELPLDHQLHIGDSLPLLTAANLSGAFQNIASGQRIATAEGAGTFLLTITDTAVLLSDFQSDIHLSASTATPSTFTLSFTATLNPTIQTSTNLLDWLTLSVSNVTTNNDQIGAAVSINPSEPQRFYRLIR